MHLTPPSPSDQACHSAIALFRAIRRISTYKKLRGDPNHVTNRELYSHLNPESSVYFDSHPASMTAVLSAWCFAHREHMYLLRMEEGIGMLASEYLLYASSPNSIGDRWVLTDEALMLITNLRTDEAVDEYVAFALRGLGTPM